MKFNYKFQNLLGPVYRKGDILFTKDGNCVISPVGNKITIYDLKQNRSHTLAIESHYNYTALDVSPSGTMLIAINETGEAQLISLVTGAAVHRHKFKEQVSAVQFSPDGKYFAASCGETVYIFTSPGAFTGSYRSFALQRVYKRAASRVTCVQWADCSRLVAAGAADGTARLHTALHVDNLDTYALTGHTDRLVGAFFERDSLDIITVGRNGQVCLWEANINPDDLVVSAVQISNAKRRRMQKTEDSEDDFDDKDIIEKDKDHESEEEDATSKAEVKCEASERLVYKRLGRHYIGDEIRSAHHSVRLSAARYHRANRILVTGFTNGTFFLHEMPDVNLIHTLSISEHRIASIAISAPGDWIAFGCPNIGQLLVWEWQSEQYVLKQQGHGGGGGGGGGMTCVTYAPDGVHAATGGQDGRVKLWAMRSGLCVATFSEHSAPVSGLQCGARRVLVSASLDGTVRCYDTARYRQFRTLTSPRLAQFSCVALDDAAELCAAGGHDVFDICLWSVKFGKLLEVLSGHEAPVSSVAWAGARLASCSWDRTVRLWDCLRGHTCETLRLASDALSLAFRPDGEEFAVSTLDGCISTFSTGTCAQSGSIEGRPDLGAGRADTDLVTPGKLLKTKAFTTLCYSADGTCLLAGGNSKHVCLYSVKEAVLIKKFVITQNRSLDAVNDFVNRRLLTEFGNMALLEERGQLEGGPLRLGLPGVRHGDHGLRTTRPEVRVLCVRFSPAGESFAVVSTEGLLLYGQAQYTDYITAFRPFRLEAESTPAAVRQRLRDGDWAVALRAALQLDDALLVRRCMDTVPHHHVELTVHSMDSAYIARLAEHVAAALGARHVQHYAHWARALLHHPGATGATGAAGATGATGAALPPPALLSLERALSTLYSRLSTICEFNKYTIQCIMRVGASGAGPAEPRDESSGRGTGTDSDSDTDSDTD